MTVVVGIDPGISGAICVLNDEGPFVHVPTPLKDEDFDPEGMARLVHEEMEGADLVVLEQQQAFPPYGPRCPRCHKAKYQEGPARVFKTGRGFGLWEGAIRMAGVRLEIVAPQLWKGRMGLDKDKEKSIAKAQELFPGVNLLRTPWCRVPDHNMAEALLLAVHGRKILKK